MANNNKQIIAEMTPTQLQQLQTGLSNSVIIIKFGAEWCKPCKLIKPVCDEWVSTCPENVVYADIDIDESLDLYMAFKKNKMIKGVPTLLAFKTRNKRDLWFIPDDSVVGGDIEAVKAFFKRCEHF